MNKIEFCKTCTQKSFDKAQGIVCGLSNAKPAFEDNCPDYIKDESVEIKPEGKLRPNEQRAKIAMLLIFIVLGIDVLSGFSSYLQYNLLTAIANGEEISQAAAEANDAREGLIGLANLAAYIISAVMFIRWFRRAYYNLNLKGARLEHEDSAAASSWFIPVVNLFRPYQIMKELYTEAKNYLQRNDIEVDGLLDTNILGVWWTLWIISGLVGQVVFRFYRNAEEINELINMTIADMVLVLIGIPLALVTIKIIKDYSNVESILVDDKKTRDIQF